MNGVFLQGGGAKGAFQAGVLYGLQEKGVEFNVISGTSIGAINSYFIRTGNLHKMKEAWESIYQFSREDKKVYFEKVISNDELIDALAQIEGKDNRVEALYVNYVEIENSRPKEIVVDIAHSDESTALEAIKYSSLLPAKMERAMTMDEMINSFDSTKVFEEFKKNVIAGEYNGYKMDGGILNNNLVQPFIDNRVDMLYMIPLSGSYEIPQEILDIYDTSKLKVFRPSTKFKPGDTLRFEKEFCMGLFKEGYEMAVRD